MIVEEKEAVIGTGTEKKSRVCVVYSQRILNKRNANSRYHTDYCRRQAYELRMGRRISRKPSEASPQQTTIVRQGGHND